MLQATSSGYVITVNSSHSKTRQKFSCAHEIAHLFLNNVYRTSPLLSYRTEESSSKLLERACDQLAAKLLMPAQVFLEATERTSGGIGAVSELANQFETSIEATALRMLDLSTEPCALAKWTSLETKRGVVRPQWTRQNMPRKVHKANFPAATTLAEYSTIATALETQSVVSGYEPIRFTSGQVREARCYTEAKRFGGQQTPFVLSFTYFNDRI
jgi:hypothetical protein